MNAETRAQKTVEEWLVATSGMKLIDQLNALKPHIERAIRDGEEENGFTNLAHFPVGTYFRLGDDLKLADVTQLVKRASDAEERRIDLLSSALDWLLRIDQALIDPLDAVELKDVIEKVEDNVVTSPTLEASLVPLRNCCTYCEEPFKAVYVTDEEGRKFCDTECMNEWKAEQQGH